MSKKGEYAKFKNYEKKLKSLLMIYADFENILVPKESETWMSVTKSNIKNMLLAFNVIK